MCASAPLPSPALSVSDTEYVVVGEDSPSRPAPETLPGFSPLTTAESSTALHGPAVELKNTSFATDRVQHQVAAAVARMRDDVRIQLASGLEIALSNTLKAETKELKTELKDYLDAALDEALDEASSAGGDCDELMDFQRSLREELDLHKERMRAEIDTFKAALRLEIDALKADLRATEESRSRQRIAVCGQLGNISKTLVGASHRTQSAGGRFNSPPTSSFTNSPRRPNGSRTDSPIYAGSPAQVNPEWGCYFGSSSLALESRRSSHRDNASGGPSWKPWNQGTRTPQPQGQSDQRLSSERTSPASSSHGTTAACPHALCREEFPSWQQLQQHAAGHARETTVGCYLCDRRLGDARTLAQHLEEHRLSLERETEARARASARASPAGPAADVEMAPGETPAPPDAPRPYKCWLCAQAFFHHEHRQEHLRLHRLFDNADVLFDTHDE